MNADFLLSLYYYTLIFVAHFFKYRQSQWKELGPYYGGRTCTIGVYPCLSRRWVRPFFLYSTPL